MMSLIDDYLHIEADNPTDPDTFRKWALDVIKVQPKDVLFIANDADADVGRAALTAGFNVILMLPQGRIIHKLDEESKKIPFVRSFDDIKLID